MNTLIWIYKQTIPHSFFEGKGGVTKYKSGTAHTRFYEKIKGKVRNMV